jgi:DNA-3-methyladenine glycosylase I
MKRLRTTKPPIPPKYPEAASSLRLHADGLSRCGWCGIDPLYMAYHDDEWGRPQHDDIRLFEKICLEGFQSGLSWLTILRKRENFRRAFQGFDPRKVALLKGRDVRGLLNDAGIVRHRGKIESTINNAQRALELINDIGSLSDHLWRFAPTGRVQGRQPRAMHDLPSKTPESIALSKDLRKRGWSFVGPTTMYAFMQAVGMVNDHFTGCDFRAAVQRAQLATTTRLDR